ncbi:hypothetical protein [Muricoccus radiodurans]|uniref:hypothetical protein n=1 Tax=Muricoccus radiodurans TaxID=2231721 RepID=UPI003CF13316
MAGVLGVSERVVAGRKADGRLPKLEDGSVDLHAVIRAGVAALGQRQTGRAETPASEAFDQGLRMGAGTGAGLAISFVTGAPMGEDPDGHHEKVVSAACELFGIPRHRPDHLSD